MQIRIDCYTISGTALEIVKELGKFVLYNKKKSADDYMSHALKCSGVKKKLSDKTLEKRCESFLKELEKHGYLKIL